MLLRSGRKLKIQRIVEAHKKRKASSIKMPGGSTSGAEGRPSVAFQVINTRTSLVPFAGKINGVLQQNLEAFIHAVDDLLAAKQLTDPNIILAEAKSYLDLSKGDLGAWSRSLAYSKCRTLGELKTFLRSVYGHRKDQDSVLQLRELFKLSDRNGRSLVANNALTNDLLTSFRLALETSSWVDQTTQTITLDNLVTLLQLSSMTAALPDALVANFDISLSEKNTETDVFQQVTKHAQKVPQLDTTIFVGRGLNEKLTPTAMLLDEKPMAIAATRYSSPPTGTQRQECINCRRPGHDARSCRVFYCYIHKSEKHSFHECRQNPFRSLRAGGDRNYQTSAGSSFPRGQYQQSGRGQSQYNRTHHQQGPNRGQGASHTGSGAWSQRGQGQGQQQSGQQQSGQQQSGQQRWASNSQGKNSQGQNGQRGQR